VYDTSGPWGDETVAPDVKVGLAPLRHNWVLKRGDVEEIDGRLVRPQDDGWLSESHRVARRNGSTKSQAPNSKEAANFNLQNPNFVCRKVLRAKSHPITQLYYAKRGIITPEMEFIAIRENLASARDSRAPFGDSPNGSEIARNDLRFCHAGSE